MKVQVRAGSKICGHMTLLSENMLCDKIQMGSIPLTDLHFVRHLVPFFSLYNRTSTGLKGVH